MSIPKADLSGLLPPFLKSPVRRESVSPYPTTTTELCERYATSPRRIQILEGLLAYRSELRRVGLSTGFQWIDGSFVEEKNETPGDVDVVTVSALPLRFSPSDEHLFDSMEVKRRYLCDAYFVDVGSGDAFGAMSYAVYLHGLFSHQRHRQRWKRLVQIALAPPDADAEARALLTRWKGRAS